MEIQPNHLFAIAEKLTRMQSLGEDFKSGAVFENSCVLFNPNNKQNYFSIKYNRSTHLAEVILYTNSIAYRDLSIRVVFLTVGNREIASRLEVTESGVKTNYITLLHFIELNNKTRISLLK